MTRHPFARTLIVIFFLLTNLLPVAQPTVVRAAPPTPVKAEANTAIPAPAATARLTPIPPRPDTLPATAQEARVRQVAEAALQKDVDYYGPRDGVSIAEVVIDGAWAYAVTQPQAPDAQPLYLLARMEGGVWRVATPKEAELYGQWLADAPISLLNAAKKDELDALAAQTISFGRSSEIPDDSLPEVKMLNGPAIVDPTPTPTPQVGKAELADSTTAPRLFLDRESNAVSARAKAEVTPEPYSTSLDRSPGNSSTAPYVPGELLVKLSTYPKTGRT